MIRHYGKVMAALFLILVSQLALGQDVVVSGKVTDATDGSGLPGVNILEKGTQNGALTDNSGDYTIRVNEGAILVFSFVGFAAQEIQVSGQTTINVSLALDVTQLGEVVVIGYGTIEKKDITGAVAEVSTESFNKGVMASPQDLIVGKLAGVNVTTNSGAPGAGSTIRIRGGSSLNATNDPLIIIDGFPVDNNGISGVDNILATINPNDIETFTVLKDASSTAIYGSRASNGVILITTKKGQAGKPKFNFSTTLSMSTPAKYFDVLTADEYRTLVNDMVDLGDINQADVDTKLGDVSTDWQKEIFRNALSTDNNLSVAGSFKEIPYRVSYGYTFQEGILENTDIERNSLNVSLMPSFFNDKLKVTVNAKGSNVQSNFGDASAVGDAVSYDPTKPVRDGNELYGGYFSWLSVPGVPANNITFNPVAKAELTDNRGKANRLIGNVELDYELTSGLHALLNVGMDYQKSEGYNYAPTTAEFTRVVTDGGTVLDGRDNIYSAENKSRLLDFYLKYTKNLGDHKIDATGGYSWQYFYRQNESTNRRADGSVVNVPPPLLAENYLISFFGRAQYSFLDKYIVSGTVRYDGSSRFNDPWGLFPAVSVAWRIKEESFLAGVDQLSELKLRVGYGETGQQDIGVDRFYPGLAIYRTSNETAQYQLGNTFYSTLRPDAYDPNIKWETTSTLNVGLDFGLFNNRLTGTLEVYQRKTYDLLNNVQVAAGTNFSNFVFTNVGDLENNGVEITLEAVPVSSGDFTWNLGANFAMNNNKITKLLLIDDPSYNGVPAGSIGVGQFIQNQQVGYPINSFWVLQQVYGADGLPVEGLYVNRSGESSVVSSNNNNKYRPEHPIADYLIGLNSRFNYKKFDFSFSGRLSLGNYVYNNAVAGRAFLNRVYSDSHFKNVPSAISQTGFYGQQQLSDFYLEDASFFKMDNLSVGYTTNNLASGKIKGRVSLTVQNAFVITDYQGVDPEVNGGIDNTVYPRPRVFLLGLSLDF